MIAGRVLLDNTPSNLRPAELGHVSQAAPLRSPLASSVLLEPWPPLMHQRPDGPAPERDPLTTRAAQHCKGAEAKARRMKPAGSARRI